MAWIPAPKTTTRKKGSGRAENERSESGVALFMVMAAMSVLSILVTEFTYTAQLNQSMAFDALDQLKAHYLAKSGLKLSLLRLKAYTQVKAFVGNISGGGALPVPKSLLNKIWDFPFFYPIPTDIPGMTMSAKDAIDKFQKGSGLDGKFSATIESESSKFNLNQILAPFSSIAATPSGTPTPATTSSATPTPTPSPSFSADAARQSLQDFLTNLMNNKIEQDDDFRSEYRDFKMDDLMDSIIAWADRTYERKNHGSMDEIAFKRAPFYMLSELHMIPGMDDELYDLFAPNLTVSTTPGVNVNTMKDATLRGIFPQITQQESDDFFKFRDDPDQDNQFQKQDDFFQYLETHIEAFVRNPTLFSQVKSDLQSRNIYFVTDETQFKITVQAQVNQATRLIEAWVTLTGTPKPGASGTPTNQPSPIPSVTQNGDTPRPDPGLKIVFMRFL